MTTKEYYRWVQTVSASSLPKTFELRRGERVVDVPHWLETVKEDALLGSKSPRAFFGALQDDIRVIERVVWV